MAEKNLIVELSPAQLLCLVTILDKRAEKDRGDTERELHEHLAHCYLGQNDIAARTRTCAVEQGWVHAATKPYSPGPKLVFGLTETMGWGYSVESYDKTYGWTGRHTVTHWRNLPLPPAELSCDDGQHRAAVADDDGLVHGGEELPRRSHL